MHVGDLFHRRRFYLGSHVVRKVAAGTGTCVVASIHDCHSIRWQCLSSIRALLCSTFGHVEPIRSLSKEDRQNLTHDQSRPVLFSEGVLNGFESRCAPGCGFH